MKRHLLRLTAATVGLSLVAGVGAVSSVSAAPAVAPPTLDIVGTASAAGGFTTLLAAATSAGLVDALKGPGPLTVFAPTDAAFASLLTKLNLTAPQLLASKALLTFVLKYHVISGKILSTDLAARNEPVSLAGVPLLVKKDASGVTINGYAKVVTADILATNGVIHVVDSVLLPLLAPSEIPAPNIVEVASATGRFTTLLAAAQAAGLVDALTGPGPLTVFAPTDAAFRGLLRRLHTTPAKLLANTSLLKKVLLYHVVSGRITSADIASGRSVVTTLGGGKIVVRKNARGVTLNGNSRVTTADVLASNGVIHVISRVLMPR